MRLGAGVWGCEDNKEDERKKAKEVGGRQETVQRCEPWRGDM
jgi:hypothetical protein